MDSQKSLVLSIVGKDESKQAFDSVSKNLKVTEKEAFNFGKTMDNISSSLSSFGKSMSLKVTAPLVALGGFAIQSGAELDSLKGAYKRMTDTMGISSDELMAKMKEVSNGTIAQKDLILAANKGMSLGVIKNVDDMATIMEIARVKGQTMGLSMTQAFNDLVTGLGRGSAMILDNLGITIKVGEVNEAYAKSLGKTVQELTAAEQKQALVNAVVGQGKEELLAMGEVSITNQERIAQMTAKLSDMKAELGEKLLPYVVKFVEVLLEWANKFQALDDRTKNIILVVAGLAAALGPLAIILSSLITVVGALGTAIAFLASPIGLIVLAIAGLIAIGVLLWKNWDTIKWAAGEFWKYLTDVWGKGTDWLKEKIDGMIGWFNNLIDKIKSALDWIKKYSGYNAISSGISNIAGSFGGARASGGPVVGGSTYLVGENGPELFTSKSSGTIIPNNRLGGGGSINITITGNTLLDSRAGERIGDLIIKKLKLSNAL